MRFIKIDKKNKELLTSLLFYLKQHKKSMITAAISMIVLAAIRGLIVYIIGPLIQGVFIDKNLQMLKEILILLPILFVIRMIAEYINNYFMNYIGQKIVQQIREELFVHIHNLSMEFYWRRRSSDIMSRVINDLNNIQSTIQFIPLYGIRDVMTVLSLTFVLFFMNWKLAIIAFLVIPFASQILKILGRKMRKSSKESQDIISDISHKFQESLQGIAIVKAFNYEKRAIDKFNQVNQEYFNKIMRYLRATSISGPIMEFLGSIILILLIIIGSHWIFSGEMKPATFFSFIAAFFTAYIPLKNISNLNSKLQMGLASWDRIYQILKEKPAVLEITNPIKIERINGKIEFKNVYYRYPTSKNWILKNISFTINPNEVAAFVGPSGSGKSTIIQLILRFFDPNEGNILIDDIDIKKIDIKSLREFMSIVTQDTILFDDTVKNNISMGKENAQEQEIIEAAKSADAELFIKNMPAGYETIIGERGIKVSGGQRQRLAIARAIIRKPKILLLDEATSNLDTKSEAIVQKAIENVLKDKTVIMSAHRLSTVKNASKIFVLRDGEIIESGDHSTLMQKKGEYRKFFEAQI
jgi:subfamily B ATP-binding cassette protein MsbA